MRAELFKDIINDSDNEEEQTETNIAKRTKSPKNNTKRIQPNYKIESIQYDGGQNSGSAESLYEGGDSDLYSQNQYMNIYATK